MEVLLYILQLEEVQKCWLSCLKFIGVLGDNLIKRIFFVDLGDSVCLMCCILIIFEVCLMMFFVNKNLIVRVLFCLGVCMVMVKLWCFCCFFLLKVSLIFSGFLYVIVFVFFWCWLLWNWNMVLDLMLVDLGIDKFFRKILQLKQGFSMGYCIIVIYMLKILLWQEIICLIKNGQYQLF